MIMTMRKVLVITFMLLPLLVMAQNTGGEIRRPVRVNSQTMLQSVPRSHDAILQDLINNMEQIEGGTFLMGATSEQGEDANGNEKPVHQVTLSSFSIGKYEVTQEEWETVMGKNPSDFKGAKRPVELVSWNDCQAFISKLNEITGMSFRLPTEAEWEFAARGGAKSLGYKYSGGNSLGIVAWYKENSGSTTHEVGKKAPNELGLYDMSGNVWEWCSDGNGRYESSAQTNPTGDDSNEFHVTRGGCWSDVARDCRVSTRGSVYYKDSGIHTGFRLAM